MKEALMSTSKYQRKMKAHKRLLRRLTLTLN